MIDRVLQRPFVLWQADQLVEADVAPAVAPLPEGVEQIGQSELQQVQRLLGAAVLEEREQPPTPPPTLPEDERLGGEEPPPIERLSWFPRDVLLSLTQSALELSLVTHHPELRRRSPATIVVPTRHCRRPPGRAWRSATTRISPEDAPPDDRRLADVFSMTDPGWASSVVAMGWRLFKKRKCASSPTGPPHRIRSRPTRG